MPLLVKIAACALALSSLTSGLPSAGKYVLHEKRSELAESTLNIQKRTKLPGGHVLPIRIGLTQSGLESGHDWLMDVSHPGKSFVHHICTVRLRAITNNVDQKAQTTANTGLLLMSTRPSHLPLKLCMLCVTGF